MTWFLKSGTGSSGGADTLSIIIATHNTSRARRTDEQTPKIMP